MAPAKGNKHAEKWDRDKVELLLDDMYITAKEKNCYYLGTLLVRYNLYKDIWCYWKEKFKEDEDVFRAIKKIDQVFEEKLFSGALMGDFNPAISIFGLKNNHKWTDQPQPEVIEAKTSLPLNIESDPEAKKELAKGEDEISLEKDDRYRK